MNEENNLNKPQNHQLNIAGVRQRFLNIKGVMELGDMAERTFFNWLNANNIWWTQKGSNLENIVVFEKDIEPIKKYWNEVNVA